MEEQDTPENQAATTEESTTTDNVSIETQTDTDQLLVEIYVEPAYITTEIDASIQNPPQNLDQQIVFELLAMASHHLQLNGMTTTDGIQNAANTYNFILESAKVIREQGAECNEIIYTLGVLRQNMVRGEGIRGDLVRQWTQQNIDVIRVRG